MNPSVTTHLIAVRRRLAESILPALPADAEFAREQAAFVLKSLDLVLSIQEYSYRYEVIELHDYLAGMRALSALDVSNPIVDELRAQLLAALDEPSPGPDEALTPLAVLEHRVQSYKALVGAMFEAVSRQAGAAAEEARAVMTRLAGRQVERERALFSATGYTETDRPLAAIMGEGPTAGAAY